MTGGAVWGADGARRATSGDEATADSAADTVTTADASAANATTRDATTRDTARDETTADRTTADRTAADGTTLLLGLVLDEVYFGFGGLSGSGGGDGDVGLLVGFLDQDVYEGLLFVLGLSGDDGCDWCGRCWSLNEDDLVVLLGYGSTADHLWALFFGFWGWDVDVDVLLDNLTTEAASESTTGYASESTTGSASESTTGSESTTRSESATRSESTADSTASDTEAAGAQTAGGESTAVTTADAAADAAAKTTTDATPMATETATSWRVVGVSGLGSCRADRRNGC